MKHIYAIIKLLKLELLLKSNFNLLKKAEKKVCFFLLILADHLVCLCNIIKVIGYLKANWFFKYLIYVRFTLRAKIYYLVQFYIKIVTQFLLSYLENKEFSGI